MPKKSVNLIVGSRGGHAAVTLCLGHAGALIAAVSGEVEVGRGSDEPCDLCRTVEGRLVELLASGDPQDLHDAHQALGLPAVDSDEQALREIALAALTRLGLAQLCAPSLDR